MLKITLIALLLNTQSMSNDISALINYEGIKSVYCIDFIEYKKELQNDNKYYEQLGNFSLVPVALREKLVAYYGIKNDLNKKSYGKDRDDIEYYIISCEGGVASAVRDSEKNGELLGVDYINGQEIFMIRAGEGNEKKRLWAYDVDDRNIIMCESKEYIGDKYIRMRGGNNTEAEEFNKIIEENKSLLGWRWTMNWMDGKKTENDSIKNNNESMFKYKIKTEIYSNGKIINRVLVIFNDREIIDKIESDGIEFIKFIRKIGMPDNINIQKKVYNKETLCVIIDYDTVKIK